jgi:hypothetical protein
MRSARVAVRRLRTGIVPDREVERLSVGISDVKVVVDSALSALVAGKWPKSLFVHGEWGSGKTHLLSLTRRLAELRGVPSTGVIVNARGSSLTHPQYFYPLLVGSIRTREEFGLRQIILRALDDDERRVRVQAFAQTTFAGDLRIPLLSLCSAWESRDPIGLEDHEGWRILLGGDLGWADYAYKRTAALARISSLLYLFRAIGLWGLAIALDELETIDQLWNVRSRLASYAVLGQLTRMPGAWCIFGVTKRFERTISADIDKGILQSAEIDKNADWFLRSWVTGYFEAIAPPTVNIDNARKLAEAITRVYREAYPDSVDDVSTAARCVRDWNENPARNPRRLIRMLIQRLDMNRHLEVT